MEGENWVHLKLSLLFSALFFSIVMLRNEAIVMLRTEASISAMLKMLRSSA